MTEYSIIIEGSGTNFAAYAPDAPCCVAAADTVDETRLLMEEALTLHIKQLREMGAKIPRQLTQAVVVQIAS